MDKKLADTPYAYYQSPIGLLRIGVSGGCICEVAFIDNPDRDLHNDPAVSALHLECIEQLIQYFHVSRRQFELPLAQPGTDFQQSVWSLLMSIPFGKTLSYLQLATQTGDPKATRAVANANSKNNIAIIVPCHRVIGTKGELTGYAGGLWRKKWLLDHERKLYYGIQTLF